MENFIIGVNYWPTDSNIKVWSRFNVNEINKDFELMKELGINTIRAFILDEDCSDKEANFKEECKTKLSQFLDIAERNSIKVLLTLIVGHMSGKNWRIPWDEDNSIYDEIQLTKKFITQVVSHFKSHRALLGWVLTNEISLVKIPQSDEQFFTWLKEMYEAIKSIDNQHLISLGDSVSPFSPTFLKPENVKGIVDYASPHIYLYDNDPIRLTMQYFMTLEYDRSSGLPVILEEFGLPTAVYSEESVGRFVGLILRGALVYGAKGALVWCFSDFTREEDEPYLWEPHELTFGIVRKDRSLKRSALELKNFSTRKLGKYQIPKRIATIMIPTWLYKNFQFVPEQSKRSDFVRALSEAFILARLSNIQVTFSRENDDLKDYKLIIVPSMTRLLNTTWRRLLKAVENGSTLYFSTAMSLHMSATHLWEEMFGVVPKLEAGSKGVKLPKVIKFENGEEINLGGEVQLLTYSFKEKDASVIGVDEEGIGRVFLARRGKGYVVLSTIPFELISSSRESINRNLLRFYGYLAELTNITQKYVSNVYGVEVQFLEGEKDDLLGVINHSWENKEVNINAKIIEDIDVCVKGETVSLAPKSACLMRVSK